MLKNKTYILVIIIKCLISNSSRERFYALGFRVIRVNKRVLTRKIEQFRVTLRDITPKPNVTRNYAKANLKKNIFLIFSEL